MIFEPEPGEEAKANRDPDDEAEESAASSEAPPPAREADERVVKPTEVPRPARRPLKIYAFDPMLGRSAPYRIVLDVPNELGLLPGPIGSRLEVVDYDASLRQFYPHIDLNDPEVLMGSGLDPTESDPRFHQQMVYAVASRVIENFERALGRRWTFKGGRRLLLYPHAFQMRNAYFDRQLKAILFGYFPADPERPGANVPGQAIFTCLSHDIIAHEMTHAMVDRLREYYLEPSNPDVLAFHEGFADIVAIFQHFSFPAILEDTIQRRRSDLRSIEPLVTLAQQFGYATGSGKALRDVSAVEDPDPTLYETEIEAHERGSILVSAVFDAFFRTYQRRIADLIRIATGGSGRLPEGDLHPDLVKRIAAEAATTAQTFLTMCIRAFEYLPPVDVTFSDFLRAVVTADHELAPDDPLEQRNALIDAFRIRGITLDEVSSLSLEAIKWPLRTDPLAPLPAEEVQREIDAGARTFTVGSQGGYEVRRFKPGPLIEWARTHASELLLDPHPDRKIELQGFHSLWRITRQGGLTVELVAQFVQSIPESESTQFAGARFRGGTTIVADADGFVRYVIAKPLPQKGAAKGSTDQRHVAGLKREAALRRYIDQADQTDPRVLFDGAEYLARRQALRSSITALHAGIQR